MKVRSVLPMQTAKLGNVAAALLVCVFGIFLIAKPETGTAMVGTAAGILLTVSGVFRLIGYFAKDLYRLAFQFDLALGVLMTVLGVLLLAHPQNLLHFLCIAAGIYVIADGLFRLQTALEAKRFGIKSWWAILAAAAVTCVIGLLLLLNPGSSARVLMRLLGGVIFAEGILNLITVLITMKIVRNQMPDVIETEAYERKEA